LGVSASNDGAEYEKESELEVCDDICTDTATPVPWPAGILHVTCVSDHDNTSHELEPKATVPPLDGPPSEAPVMVIVEPPIEGADEGNTLDTMGGLYEN
jgi:hypothetical protein